MWLRLRQICLVTAAIEGVVEDLQKVFGLEVCHIDPAVGQYGLENRLLPVGNQFLELVAPTEPGTAAGRYLKRRGGDGGYMVITQCDDLGPRRAQVDALGVRVANALDYDDFQGMQLHPRDTGGAFFEIDHQRDGEAEDGPWHPAGGHWQAFRRTNLVNAISGVELQSPDPLALAERWAAIAQLDLTRTGQGYAMELQNAAVSFVEATDGRGEGLSGLELKAPNRATAMQAARTRGLLNQAEEIEICGVRFRLV